MKSILLYIHSKLSKRYPVSWQGAGGWVGKHHFREFCYSDRVYSDFKHFVMETVGDNKGTMKQNICLYEPSLSKEFVIPSCLTFSIILILQ